MLLLFSFPAFASNFTQVLTAGAETCSGNGKLTIAITNSNAGVSQFTFKIYNGTSGTVFTPNLSGGNPQTVTSATANFTHEISGFVAGTYRLETTEIDGTETPKVSTTQFTIANAKKPISFSTSKDVCSARLITAKITTAGNAPYIYRLVASATGQIVEESQPTTATSYTFSTSLANGYYNVLIGDTCGDFYGPQVVQILPPVISYKFVMRNYLGTSHTGHVLTDCNTVVRNFDIRYFEDGVNKTIPAARFPISVTYTIPGYGGAPVTTITQTYNSAAEMQNIFLTTPFYYNQSNQLTLTANDACPDTLPLPTDTYTAPVNTGYFDLTTSALVGSACTGAKILSISRLETFDYTANNNLGYQVKVEKLLGTGAVDTSFNGSYSGYNFVNGTATSYKTNYSKIDISGIPTGSFRVTVDDGCRNITKTINVTGPIYALQANTWAGCNAGTGTFHLYVGDTTIPGNPRGAFLTSIYVTDAPAAFRALHGLPATGPINFNISNYIDPGTNNADNADGMVFVSGFTAGSYQFSYTSTCNNGTGSYTVTNKTRQSYNSAITLTCDGFTINSTLSSNYGRAIMYVQKYYDDSGAWGHPQTGALFVDNGTNIITDTNAFRLTNSYSGGTPGNNGEILTISSPTTSQVVSSGDMRVIVQYVTYMDGQAGATGMSLPPLNYCRETLQTFHVPGKDIEVHDFIVVTCADGTNNLIIDAQGVNLSYQIIEKNGVSFVMPATPQSSGIFTNLQPAEYKVRITDTCGRERVLSFFVTAPEKLPQIKATQLCENAAGSLFIEGFNFLHYVWYKNGTPIAGASGIGYNTLNFANFQSATDAGVYTVTLSLPGTCLDETLTYTVQPIGTLPNAGTGQTVTLDINNVTAPINLFYVAESTLYGFRSMVRDKFERTTFSI